MGILTKIFGYEGKIRFEFFDSSEKKYTGKIRIETLLMDREEIEEKLKQIIFVETGIMPVKVRITGAT